MKYHHYNATVQEICQECLECQECDNSVFHGRPRCLVYRKTMWLSSPRYSSMLQATLPKNQKQFQQTKQPSHPSKNVIQKLPVFNLINPFYQQHHITSIQSQPSHTNPNPNIHPSIHSSLKRTISEDNRVTQFLALNKYFFPLSPLPFSTV